MKGPIILVTDFFGRFSIVCHRKHTDRHKVGLNPVMTSSSKSMTPQSRRTMQNDSQMQNRDLVDQKSRAEHMARCYAELRFAGSISERCSMLNA